MSISVERKWEDRKETCQKWISSNRAQYLEIARKASGTPEAIARRMNYAKMNPNKTKATQAVYRAIKRGDLAKLPCEVCGENTAQAHHKDYLKQLNVMWLCVPHHNQWHVENGPGINEDARSVN